jgi:hypothetical protein
MHQQYGVNVVPFHPSDWGSSPDSRNAGFELIGMNFDGFWNPTLPLKSNISFHGWFRRERSTRDWD